MFKLKVTDAKLLRDMATAISILVDEATFKIEPDGLKLRAMDPSRVAMIDFEWPKSIFEEYVSNEPTKMCINISELLKLLNVPAKTKPSSYHLTTPPDDCKLKSVANTTETLLCPRLKHPKKKFLHQKLPLT